MGYWGDDCDIESYKDMVTTWGFEVLVWVEDEDYQGDTHTILRDGDRYGYLTFGWGSCSGCDALEACDDKEEVEQLSQELKNDIHWELSKQELADHFVSRDWETKWMWHKDEFKDFLRQASEALAITVWFDGLEWADD